MSAIANPTSRRATIILWILRGLMAALFLFGAIMKLTNQQMMVQEFDAVGFGQWFRYVTGLLELVGGIAILVPRVSVLGATILLCVDIGAFVAQVSIPHVDWIHTVVAAAILVAVLCMQRVKLG
ncbi:DoxX family protein [Paraburkholderia nemoris]|uniref:DoxX family protein n=1 Tax=Paraburkholderia nemoris TaxID=2793076 RepID=UPI001B1418BB|nr:DoxX family protein [Paraburkholderia nemoris]CAE6750473.1 hypothetical protein R75777_02966 [Paraburkholderia nemoris]